MRAEPAALLTCAFHWYAISAYQYVLTVGAIAHRLDNGRPLPKVYVQAVIPEVLAFRDKVAAHFAWSTKNSNDNEAERIASIMPLVSFVGDSFHAGAFSSLLRTGAKESRSDSITPWSIRDVHERLRTRYWPSS